MKVVFFGSDDFSVAHLKALLSEHAIVACVTKPDAPSGRGMAMQPSLVKVLAQDHGIPCLQPATLKNNADMYSRLKDLKADLFVVVSYGLLLPAEVLALPRFFCVNVHGSLLPHYRGAAPIQWAILNGDSCTGITVQKMALEMDAGDILAQDPVDIPLSMSADQLRQEMMRKGPPLLLATLDHIHRGTMVLTPQDRASATYAPKLHKALGRIEWANEGGRIYNQVRGLKPWPGAYTSVNGRTLKILEAVLVAGRHSVSPGTVVSVEPQGIMVACGKDALRITMVQPESATLMTAASFAAGHRISKGTILGTAS